MADVKTAIMRAALRITTGTQDFEVAGFGTPKAAKITATIATVDGTVTDGITFSIGCTDGTRQWVTALQSDHASVDTDTRKRGTTDECLFILNPATGNILCEANFDSWSANGVTLNVTVTDGVAYLVTVELFGGADLQAYAAAVNVTALVDVAQDITAPGFAGQLLFAACNERDFDDVRSVPGNISWGWAYDGVSVTQKGLAHRLRPTFTTSECQAYFFSNRICGALDNSAVIWAIEVSDFDANGFSFTPRTAASNEDVGYLLLDLGGLEGWVDDFNTPASTGNDAQTGPGFTPQYVSLGCTMLQAEDSFQTGAQTGAFASSVFTPTAEFCNAFAEEDNVGTTDNQCVSDNQAVNLDDHTGAAAADATFISMDAAAGFTLNYSVKPATAVKFFGAAIEEVAVGGLLRHPGMSGGMNELLGGMRG